MLAAALLFTMTLGGSGVEDCDDIAVARDGDLFLACHVSSLDFPGLTGKARDDFDAVIVRLDGRTRKVRWAVRHGGSAYDNAFRVEVDRRGLVHIVGITQSADFPTTEGAHQREYKGKFDAFYARFSDDGRLLYSTLIGTEGDDFAALALRGDGRAVIGGVVNKQPFLAVAGDPFQLTVLSGAPVEKITGVAVDRRGNAWISGFTAHDAVLMKVRLNDSTVLLRKEYGGSGEDSAWAIAVDGQDRPYISGITTSPDLPVAGRPFQSKPGGGNDAFLAGFERDGRLRFATYFGGAGDDQAGYDGSSLGVDRQGRLWMAGMTDTKDLPTAAAPQPRYGGGSLDGFYACFSKDGSRVVMASYLGGPDRDLLEGIRLAFGRVYVAGLTASGARGQFDVLIAAIELR